MILDSDGNIETSMIGKAAPKAVKQTNPAADEKYNKETTGQHGMAFDVFQATTTERIRKERRVFPTPDSRGNIAAARLPASASL